MKKKLATALMVLCMMATMLAGCGKEPEETVDETQETNAEPVYMTFDGYGMVMGMLSYMEDDGENGTFESETVSIDFEGVPGQKIREVWKNAGYSDMYPYCDGEVFEGWMEYKTNRETGEDGFDIFYYERISGDTLITTEELMELTVPDYDVMYVVKWESIFMEEYDEFYASTSGEQDFVETQDIYLLLNADGGMMTFDAEEPYETDIYLYYLQEGKTVRESMEEGGNDPFGEVKKDGAEFAGWTIYEGDFADWPDNEPEDLAEGAQFFSAGGYMNLVLDNCEIYGEAVSTEELREILCEGRTFYAVANWK